MPTRARRRFGRRIPNSLDHRQPQLRHLDVRRLHLVLIRLDLRRDGEPHAHPHRSDLPDGKLRLVDRDGDGHHWLHPDHQRPVVRHHQHRRVGLVQLRQHLRDHGHSLAHGLESQPADAYASSGPNVSSKRFRGNDEACIGPATNSQNGSRSLNAARDGSNRCAASRWARYRKGSCWRRGVGRPHHRPPSTFWQFS